MASEAELKKVHELAQKKVYGAVRKKVNGAAGGAREKMQVEVPQGNQELLQVKEVTKQEKLRSLLFGVSQ